MSNTKNSSDTVEKLSHSDVMVPCEYCENKFTPRELYVHYLRIEGETPPEAFQHLNRQLTDLETDEDGNPITECSFHGWYESERGCYGCDRDDERAEPYHL